MAAFAVGFCMLFGILRLGKLEVVGAALFSPMTFFNPVPSPAYHEVAASHPYHYLLRWHWYEVLGAVGPLIILWWYGQFARTRRRTNLDFMCKTAVVLGVISLAAASLVGVSAI
jgi:hypothetical protein